MYLNSQSLADGAVGEAMEPLESTPLMKEVYPSQSRESWDLVVGLALFYFLFSFSASCVAIKGNEPASCSCHDAMHCLTTRMDTVPLDP